MVSFKIHSAVANMLQSDSATPWTIACQALLSMGFSRQKYWNEVPFPPGNLTHPRIKPTSLMSPGLAGRGASLVAQRLKRLPAMRETWV